MINIKLDKCGGLTEALAMVDEAHKQNMRIMVGCMLGSSLAMEAALPVAVHAEHVDLDGPIWLAKDREGGVTLRDGLLWPPAPGFWGQPIRTTASTSTA